MMRSRWSVPMVAAVLGLAVLLPSCDFAPGKPFTWKSTIDTEFDIPGDADRPIGAYQFYDPFELHPGTVGLKLTTRVSKAQIGSMPQSLQWTWNHYDPTKTTILDTYSLTAPLKMRPAGGGYGVSYTLKPQTFPGFTLGQDDYLQMNLKPIGGSLPTGLRLGVSYAYHPTMPSGNAPVITGIVPWSGAIGSHVEIDGMRLGGKSATVKFNGTAGTVNFGDDLSIDVTVPPGATSGPISVKTSAGTATSSGSFTVQ